MAEAEEQAAERPLVLTCWMSDAARQRLVDAGDYELTEDLERAGDADLIAVSTRLPKGRTVSIVAELRATTGNPIVAIAHAGGENVAVEMMAGGGTAVVAEGNEEALRSFLGAEPADEQLVDTYEQSLERRSDQAATGGGRDHVTGLPGATALEARLGELGQSERVPRLGFARLPLYGDAVRRLTLDAGELLRRRIAAQYGELCRHAGAEIFTLGDADFAVVAAETPLGDFENLGWALSDVATAFGGPGTATLGLAMGHAGPEAAGDMATLRELAQRALELALAEPGSSSVVGAEKLSRMLAASTEFEAARRALSLVEEHDATGPRHGERVAMLAAEIARRAGIDGRDFVKIRLAAYLHDIGKVSLPAEALKPIDELDGELLDQYKRHPQRGADLLRPSGGGDVAAMVSSYCEHWDGGGYPDGIEGEAIPYGARIIAVADALDRWSATETGRAEGYHPTAAALSEAEDGAGTRFDPDVVKAALEAFA